MYTGETHKSELSPLQVYKGFEEDDLPLLRAYCDRAAEVNSDYCLDGFGVKTHYACVPFLDPAKLRRERLQHPVPDDGFHAEAIEYVALVDAFRRAERLRRFLAVEIGAGWGPWLALAGTLAKQRKFLEVRLVGAKASRQRFALMQQHLAANDLYSTHAPEGDFHNGTIFTRLFRGVVWTHNGSIRFPRTEVVDMGASATSNDTATDYRGLSLEHVETPCLTIESLLHGVGSPVDFIHLDIQGSEFKLIEQGIDWLSSHASTLFVATHSRSIEGDLIKFLESSNWRLHREKPCQVDWRKENCSPEARTSVDGSQYWLNQNLQR